MFPPPLELPCFLLLWLWFRLRKPECGERAGTWLLLACLGALCLRLAIFTLLMVFRIYDDEGYVLYSMHNHLAGGALYDQVQSLYGPFPFFLARLQAWLGLQPSHDVGRLLTLVYWIILATGASSLSYLVTRSKVAAALCLCLSSVYLKVLANEPSHPVGLITVLAMIAACLHPGDGRRVRLKGLVLGALAGALLLTKFNTGIFLISACGLWWLWTRRQKGAFDRAAYLAGSALLLVMPLFLMKSFLRFEGVGLHLLVACLVFLGGLATMSREQSPPSKGLALGLNWLLGLVLSIACIGAYALSTGTSIQGLMDGILLSHLRNLTYYHVPMPWLPGTGAFAVVCALLCVVSPRLGPSSKMLAACLPSILALTGVLLAWSDLLPLRMEALMFSIGLPAVCTALIRTEDERHERSLLIWLFLIGTTQALHAFPVGGTHLACSSLFFLPLLILRGHDFLLFLGSKWNFRKLTLILPAALLLFVGLGIARHLREQEDWYETRRPLDLPGARTLSPSPVLAGTLRVLSTNAALHGTQLYSEPGLFSFNLWSGVSAPTGQNVTNWFKLLTKEAMTDIEDQLRRNPKAVVIRERLNRNALVDPHKPASALEDCIKTEFKTLFTLGTYSFLVKKESQAAALDLMTVYRTSEARTLILEFAHPFRASGEILAGGTLVRLTPIGTETPVLQTSPRTSWVELTPINTDGSAASKAVMQPLPCKAAGLQLVRIHISMTEQAPPEGPLMFVLQDPAGNLLGYVLQRE